MNMTSKGVPVHRVPDSGFIHALADAKVSEDSSMVEFTMIIGIKYLVPATYIHTWYREPECEFVDGKWRWREPSGRRFSIARALAEDLRIERLRRIHAKGVRGAWYWFVEIYLSNGCGHTIHPDHILIACEPRYEYFQGFTPVERGVYRKLYPKFSTSIRRTLTPGRRTSAHFGVFRNVKPLPDGRVECGMQSGDRYVFGFRKTRLGIHIARNPHFTASIRSIRRVNGNTCASIVWKSGETIKIDAWSVVRAFDERFVEV